MDGSLAHNPQHSPTLAEDAGDRRVITLPAAAGDSRRVKLAALVGAHRGLLAYVLLPLVVVLLVSVVIVSTGMDPRAQQAFYCQEEQCWQYGQDQPWKFAYDFGCAPGVILGIACTGFFVIGTVLRFSDRFRRTTLFLGLVLLLGPGLVVNGILKPGWGRPRPSQTLEFGGNTPYREVFEMAGANGHKSFPCGHASMGYFWIAPGFLLLRSRRRIALLIIALGLAYGSYVGVARMAQGAHYLSDVIWSGACVYFTTIGLYWALGLHKNRCPQSGEILSTNTSDEPATLPLPEPATAGEGLRRAA